MAEISRDIDIPTILARLDRSAPENLLASLASEFMLLHRGYLSLLARVNALEVSQTLLDQVAAPRTVAAEPLPRSVIIDAAFSLATEAGFHAVEYDQQGNQYRWTGPDSTFYFQILIDRSVPARLRLHGMRIYSEIPDQKIRCYVDGWDIEIDQVVVQGGFELQGTLPARHTPGGTAITFVCPALGSPADHGYSDDKRRLGLAFRWLRIEAGDVDLEQADPAAEIGQATEQLQHSGAWLNEDG